MSSASSTLPSTTPSRPPSPRSDLHLPLSFRDSDNKARRLLLPRSPRASSSGHPALFPLLLVALALALLLHGPLPLEPTFGGKSVACDFGELEVLLRKLDADLSLGVEREECDWGVAGEGGWESCREVGVGGAVPSVTFPAVLLWREGVSPDE